MPQVVADLAEVGDKIWIAKIPPHAIVGIHQKREINNPTSARSATAKVRNNIKYAKAN